MPRFIPARAGNRKEKAEQTHKKTVHPRPCGEQGEVYGYPMKFDGSSPPVRGTGPAFASISWTGGSSPPVRGTGALYAQETGNIRFIPARAGNRFPVVDRSDSEPVHPRPCGEQAVKQVIPL